MSVQFSRYPIFIFLLVFLAQFCHAASSPISLRINTRHGFDNAKGAVVDAGLKPSVDILVTATSQHDGRPFLTADKFFEDALASGATIMSSSFNGWNFLYDSLLYRKLTDNGMVHVYAYVPKHSQPQDTPPPAAFVTVNKIGGATGGGIEFGVPANYMSKGKSDTPSGVTAQLAGLMASLKFLHPTWNWFDIKAALRSTATNFSSGYDPLNYGYGIIDFQAANQLSRAENLPLFAPSVITRILPDERIVFQINPFKQTRRFTEVLFRFRSRPAEKMKELSLSEIVAMGGEYMYSNYLRADPYAFAFTVTEDGKPYYAWFTQDYNGRYSRLESYSIFGPIRPSAKRN